MARRADILVIGHISKDLIRFRGREDQSIGGAVVYSSVAAKRVGAEVIALTKLNPEDMDVLAVFAEHDVPVLHRASSATTSIRNTYHTPDRDRRTCEALSIADPFGPADVPEDVAPDVYYLGGLIKGEFPEELVLELAARGKVALDVQGFVRVSDNGPMVFRDWDKKKEVLPLIHFLKTDAAEAEILTGSNDVQEAARILNNWGADEVMVTHNAGVLVYAHERAYTFPFTSRDLSGRTGRGDTCFATYCAWRKNHSPEEACLFAAALTSLKMETPGPFAGSVANVERAIEVRYKL